MPRANSFSGKDKDNFTIKTFAKGKAFYKTNRGFYSVEENRYLLLNEGSYTISIDEKTEVESFCIFFRDGFAQEVLPSILKSTNSILSDPYFDMDTVEFYEKTYQITPTLILQLEKFQRHYDLFHNDFL